MKKRKSKNETVTRETSRSESDSPTEWISFGQPCRAVVVGSGQ